MAGMCPAIYGQVSRSDTKWLQATNMGDIILVGDSESVLDHAHVVMAKTLNVINTERARENLHPIGVRVSQIDVYNCELHTDPAYYHIVIFCCSSSHIQLLDSKSHAHTPFRKAYRTIMNGKTEVMYMVLGDLSLCYPNPLDRTRRLAGNPNHTGLFDSALHGAGIFKDCKVLNKKLTMGEVFSFVNEMNQSQVRQLARVIGGVQRFCKADKVRDCTEGYLSRRS